jgi:hypothetical protein
MSEATLAYGFSCQAREFTPHPASTTRSFLNRYASLQRAAETLEKQLQLDTGHRSG